MGVLAAIVFVTLTLGPTLAHPEARDVRTQPLRFDGPATPAEDRAVEAVRIGLVSRFEGEDGASAREIRRGARLAVEAANAAGGVDGRSVRLVERSSDGPWSQAAGRVVALLHEERVWALLAGPDRDSAHLALQIATKAHTPVVLPLVADDSLTAAGIPWVFRLAATAGGLEPASVDLAARYRAAHGGAPTSEAALGWDAVTMIVAGLRSVGLDRPELRAWLAGLHDGAGATGPIAFCPNGDRRGVAACLRQ